ncbi:MAG: hypothetical protein ACE141_11565 [Bryobacteraceae bacterium]
MVQQSYVTRECVLIPLVLTALVWAFTLPALPYAATTPAPGEPEVFHIYLRQVHRAVEALKQQDPSGATTSLEARAESAAARLGVRADDLPIIDAVYRSLELSLQSIDAEGKAYVEAAAAQQRKPEMSTLERFYERRIQSIKQARDQLRAALGNAAWRRCEQFFEGDFRMRIKKRALQ